VPAVATLRATNAALAPAGCAAAPCLRRNIFPWQGVQLAWGIWVGFVLAVLMAPWAHAASPPLVLQPTTRSVDTWPVTVMLPDATRALSVQDVLARQHDFVQPPRTSGSLGVRKEAVWLRIPLVSPVASANQWIVNIDFAVLNEVDFFLTTGGKVVQHAALGNLRPFSERPLRNRTPAMALDLSADTPYELFIRVYTGGAMILPITISKAPVLVPHALGEQMLQGVLAGLALCLGIYSFGQWVSQREKLFLYYAMLVAGSAGFSLQFFGIGTQFLWSNNAWIEAHAAGASGLLAIAGSFLFMGHALLGHQPGHPFLRAMQAGAGLTGALLVAFLLDLISIRTTTAIISVLGPLPSLVSLPIAIARVRKGDSVSATLLVAWVAYFAAAVVMVALVQGVLPVSFWTLHSFQLGSAADMLLFLGVLGQRSAALRAATAEAVRERDVMRSLAYTDSLTGLSNRRALQLALHAALERCSPQRLVAVYLLDLDGFKPINDTHGHDVGDDLLVAVSHRLQACVRQHTDVVARLGGDEFIIMAQDLSTPEQAHELGLSLLRAFEHPIALSELRLRVGLTVGYALAPLDSDDPHGLIRLADAAMYAGKQSGKRTLRRAENESPLP
jgi:diguanylate cyclase